MWNFALFKKKKLPHSTPAPVPGTAFWLVDNCHPIGLRGIYISSGFGLRNTGYTFWSSIENFSAFCQVLRGSILLPPRHPHVLARMARWQFGNVDWFAIFKRIMCFSVPSIIWVGKVLRQITRQRRALHPLEMPKICNTMRHIPQEDKYLIIYNRLRSFICRMLLIQPGLFFFILLSRLLIETFLGTEASQIQKQTHHIKRNSNLYHTH